MYDCKRIKDKRGIFMQKYEIIHSLCIGLAGRYTPHIPWPPGEAEHLGKTHIYNNVSLGSMPEAGSGSHSPVYSPGRKWGK